MQRRKVETFLSSVLNSFAPSCVWSSSEAILLIPKIFALFLYWFSLQKKCSAFCPSCKIKPHSQLWPKEEHRIYVSNYRMIMWFARAVSSHCCLLWIILHSMNEKLLHGHFSLSRCLWYVWQKKMVGIMTVCFFRLNVLLLFVLCCKLPIIHVTNALFNYHWGLNSLTF